MNRNRVTVRYAKALLELSVEQGNLEVINTDIALLFKAMTDYHGFYAYITNPGIPSIIKSKRVQELFVKSVNPLTIRFIELVFEHCREEYLKDICRNFLEMARKERGIITAELVMASELKSETIKRIVSKFESKTKSTIEMQSKVNHDLIGGFVFTIDGWQYDASVASKLKSLKQQLL